MTRPWPTSAPGWAWKSAEDQAPSLRVSFSGRLLDWYDANRRVLPWRDLAQRLIDREEPERAVSSWTPVPAAHTDSPESSSPLPLFGRGRPLPGLDLESC